MTRYSEQSSGGPGYTPRMIAGVIFDCDGTIVDSRDLIVPFYDWVFAQVGLPPLDSTDPEVVAIALSRSDAEVFAHVVSDPADRHRVRGFLSGLDPTDFLSDMKLEPHALEVLRELRPQYRLAIATNRGPDMTALVRHFEFDAYVDTVVTAADVQNPKPDPEMLVLAAERLGLTPQEALYVGDTEVDGLAAAAAGMQFICYQRVRNGDGAPVAPAGDGCLGDLRELPGRLRLLNARHAQAASVISTTRSSKESPAASAAMGMVEVSVKPGMVFSSSTQGTPESSRSTSTLPKPRQSNVR
jgi:phosphoglycolate phosphatase